MVRFVTQASCTLHVCVDSYDIKSVDSCFVLVKGAVRSTRLRRCQTIVHVHVLRAFAVMAKISILHIFVSRGREVEEKRPVFVSKKISVITDDPLDYYIEGMHLSIEYTTEWRIPIRHGMFSEVLGQPDPCGSDKKLH